MPDADHEEFERLIREAEAQHPEGRRHEPPAGWVTVGLSDEVAWDKNGHVHVNGVQACCARRWSRLWHALTGDHR